MIEITQPEAGTGEVRNCGRFRMLGPLGAGGMGMVIAAHDPDLDRTVALKLLHPETCGRLGADHAALLVREARGLAQVSHPNVVTVYEVGALDDQIFIAMELVDGTTLRGWLAERPRTWHEIAAMFVAAGRGLAAAHARGLVHRDFKPDNVLVGSDGRPRVTDFGLAVRAGGPAVELDGGGASTVTGSVHGTPAYMSPEQWEGRAVDPRSDQFAFCVALWEALHGERPFAGVRTSEIREAVCAGRLRDPANHRVPRWLDAALRRGLATDPAARWPELASLLGALQRGARRRRRGWATAATAVAGAGVAVLALAVTRSTPSAAPCSAVAAPFQAMWSPAERVRIAHGFVATGGPIAGSTWAKIAPAIDRLGERWVAMRHEACAATELRHEQSPALLDLRMSCLEDRRRELGAMLHVFATATPEIATAAAEGLSRLEPIARCADTAGLTGVATPPAGIAPVVDRLEAELAEIAAATRVSRIEGTRERAGRVVAAARALGYVPLEAEALFALARAQEVAGAYEEALRSAEAAALAADRGGDDRLRARAWIEAVGIAGWRLRRGEEALRARELARGALARVREPDTLPILLHDRAADGYWALGKFDDALREVDAALALVEPATDPLVHAGVLSSKGNLLAEARRYADAQAVYRQALALDEAALGAEHPRIAALLTNLAGTIQLQRTDYAEVERMQRRAIAIGARALGPDHPQVAVYQRNLVMLLLQSERFAEALPIARRVLELCERTLPPDHPDTIRSVINLASALAGLGEHRQAEPLFVRGLAMQARSVPEGHPDRAYVRGQHGINLLELGRPRDALAETDAAVAIYERLDGAASDVAVGLAWQARALLEAGDLAGALARARQAVARAGALDGAEPEKPLTEALARWHLARALAARGGRREARVEIRAALAALGTSQAPDVRALRARIERWAAGLDPR